MKKRDPPSGLPVVTVSTLWMQVMRGGLASLSAVASIVAPLQVKGMNDDIRSTFFSTLAVMAVTSRSAGPGS